MWNAITDVPGVLVGQGRDLEALTGGTVLVFPAGAVGGVDGRGSASGTRELDTLSALHVAPCMACHYPWQVAEPIGLTLSHNRLGR